MNNLTPDDPINFACGFCRYESKLELTECPGCGRIAPSPPKRGPAAPSSSKHSAAAPVQKTAAVFECVHCRYQTLAPRAECPGCGRAKFTSAEVPAERLQPAESRRRRPGLDNSGIGKVLLVFSPGFFFVAFLVFIGIGPSGTSRRSAYVAAVGENAAGAFALAAVGLALAIAGLYYRNKD